MPCLNLTVSWLWAIGTAATIALAASMIYTRQWRRWPSLFSFLCLIAIQSIACSLANFYSSPALYFVFYWALEFALHVSTVWLIIQIALRVAGITPRLRTALAKGVLMFAVLAFLTSAYLAFEDPAPPYEKVVFIVQHVEISAYLAFCLTATVLVLATKGIGVQWGGGVSGITAGLLLEVLASTLFTYLNLSYQAAVLNAIKSALYLATASIWAASVIPYHRSTRPACSFVSRGMDKILVKGQIL